MERKDRKVSELIDNPLWARKAIDQAVIVGLAGSIKAIGLQVPPIVYGRTIMEGHCRVRALRHLGIEEVECIEFDHQPTSVEVLCVQAHLDVHRTSLSAMERSDLLANIQREQKWTVTELAERLCMKQSMASKLLALQKLPADARKLLDGGKLDIERAYILTQSTDPALVQQAPTLTRDQLRQKIKGNGGGPRLSSASFYMPGFLVKMMGKKAFDLSEAADVLMETARVLLKGAKQKLSLESQVKCMRDMNKGK